MANIFKTIGNAVGGALKTVGGPLVSGGLSLIGGLMSSNSSRRAQQSANNSNMELAKYKYEKDLEMWNRQNEYNSPLAQMQRYKEAGLNPFLIYGQGSNGNATNAPTMDVPNLPSVGGVDYGQAIGNAIGAYQNVSMNQAQLNLLSKQQSKLGADETLARVRAWSEMWKQTNANDRWKIEQSWLPDWLSAQLNYKVAQRSQLLGQINYLQDQSNIARQKYEQMKLEYSLLKDKKTWYAKTLEQELKNLQASYELIQKNTTLSDWRGANEFIEHRWRVNHPHTWRNSNISTMPGQLFDQFAGRIFK